MPSPTYFITLTSLPHQIVDAAIVKSFNASWRSWTQWLRREAGLGNASWVLEQGEKTGHLHRHAIIETSRSFSYKRARSALKRCGSGVVCDFKPISRKRGARPPASYLGKYLAKDLAARWPRYSRRCQTSIPDNQIKTHDCLFIPRPHSDVPAIRLKRSRYEFAERATVAYWNDVMEEDGLARPLIALNQYDKVLHGGKNDANFPTSETSGGP